MYRPVVLFIGLRYMRGCTSDRFGRFVSWLATIGITIGVMSLITILSVMNGFEYELETNILGMIPQALITSKEGSINPKQIPLQIFYKLKGITHISPLTTGYVMLQSAHNVSVGVMLGIDPNEKDPLTPFLVNTPRILLQPGQYNVIIGKQQATKLGVHQGDHLRLIAPSVSQFTPIGRIFSQRIFNIVGIYTTNNQTEDYQILVNQQDASHIMAYPSGNITGWRLWLKEPLKIGVITQQKLPNELIWKDWRECRGDLFQAVRMEKNLIGLLISLIIVVSTFNIVTSLSLLIMEKQAEIAILQSQGLNRYQIIIVFMIQGCARGIIGTLLGTILGILIASNLNKLNSLIDWFVDINKLPIDININQIIIIGIISMATAILSTLYPSWCAASIQPAKALRYE